MVRADRHRQKLASHRGYWNLDPADFKGSMLNWNVEKAQHPDLVTEFAAYDEQLTDAFHYTLIFAVSLWADGHFLPRAKKTETVIAQSLYEAFVRGYVQAPRNRYR